MALFLTTFKSEVKGQYIACTHSFTDFVATSGGCDYLCECEYYFQIPVNLNPTLYSFEVWVNHMQVTPPTGQVILFAGDVICFLLKHPNNDIEECCYDVSDFCY